VGAVVTMVAVGNGARASIEEQVVAAGMNVITVVAGNYQMKGEDGGGGVVDHQAWFDAGPPDIALVSSHPEDDPMEKHDHPTSRQRLGDSAAGLGAAATLTGADAAAIRSECAVCSTCRQACTSQLEWCAAIAAGSRGSTAQKPDLSRIRRSWTFKHGRFFSSRESEDGDQVVVLGTVAHQRLFGGETNPVGAEVRIWNQPFRVIGVVASTNWATTGAVGDDQFDAVYVPLTAVIGCSTSPSSTASPSPHARLERRPTCRAP
jgi:putative ABC transport system permease protein